MSWKESAVGVLAKLLRPGARAGFAAALLSWLLRTAAPRRRVAEQNLRIALPEASKEERRRILKGTYDHLVWMGIEFIMLQDDPSLVLDWVEAENISLLDSLVGKGAIFISGHVGNWELGVAWLAQSGYNLTSIVRESSDPNERGLIERMRSRVGVRTMPKTTPMTRAASLLRRGEFLGILTDQHGGPEGIPSRFFGIETSTSQGAAVFAWLTKKPIIPIFTHRIAPCRHAIRVGSPIEWQPLGSRDETISHITDLVNLTMERMVLESPEQWLAQHRRFREHYKNMGI
ncbi:MAG: lysophospholipid acyltransferase family protein [Synergistaceae bacterium]|jgi:KDO2-lipid IV(A) lauroyltransferase|nr:lysophospholipid acyltransferase family protein [Synergistaceae bacterium]